MKNGKQCSQDEIIEILREVESTGNAVSAATDERVRGRTTFRLRDRFAG
jgi:hypothetical protein